MAKERRAESEVEEASQSSDTLRRVRARTRASGGSAAPSRRPPPPPPLHHASLRQTTARHSVGPSPPLHKTGAAIIRHPLQGEGPYLSPFGVERLSEVVDHPGVVSGAVFRGFSVLSEPALDVGGRKLNRLVLGGTNGRNVGQTEGAKTSGEQKNTHNSLGWQWQRRDRGIGRLGDGADHGCARRKGGRRDGDVFRKGKREAEARGDR